MRAEMQTAGAHEILGSIYGRGLGGMKCPLLLIHMIKNI